MKKLSWKPPDNFYPNYSLYNDIGYGPEGEWNLIRKQLLEYNLESNEENIKTLMEFTKELMVFIDENCKEEIIEYSQCLKDEMYVGGTFPPELELAKIIVVEILKIIVLTGLKKLYEKLKDFIKKKIKSNKQEKEKIKSEYEILLKIVQKLENNQETVEILRYSKKLVQKV